VLELGRDGNDRAILSGCCLGEGLDLTILALGRLFLVYEIDLILENDQILQLHDLNRCQMLLGLRLWARLIPSNQQHRSVHNRDTINHRRHEDIMPWAIDKAHMPL
jgi:hypothetical protein